MTNAAANEAPNVKRYEAITRGVVTAFQNSGKVRAVVRINAAAPDAPTSAAGYVPENDGAARS